MGDKRFDNRSKATFKKDIAFGTAIEKFFWRGFLAQLEKYHVKYENPSDNGVGNDGQYVETGTNTAGADYIIDILNGDRWRRNVPMEVKWVPTAGKLTLKKADMKAYVNEGAAILFIYNSVRDGVDLRKPKDYDMDKHLKRIKAKEGDLRWGVMFPHKVKLMLENAIFEPIPYMGNKMGVILKQNEFDNWFKTNKWL
jgi:hypothetical protein